MIFRDYGNLHNIASISAVTTIGFSRKRSKIPIKLFIRSRPDNKFVFSDWPLNIEAALATRLAFLVCWGYKPDGEGCNIFFLAADSQRPLGLRNLSRCQFAGLHRIEHSTDDPWRADVAGCLVGLLLLYNCFVIGRYSSTKDQFHIWYRCDEFSRKCPELIRCLLKSFWVLLVKYRRCLFSENW